MGNTEREINKIKRCTTPGIGLYSVEKEKKFKAAKNGYYIDN